MGCERACRHSSFLERGWSRVLCRRIRRRISSPSPLDRDRQRADPALAQTDNLLALLANDANTIKLRNFIASKDDGTEAAKAGSRVSSR